MRYTRLRRAIEGVTLIGTHGTPFQGGAEKNAEAQKKRKISTPPLRATSEERQPEVENSKAIRTHRSRKRQQRRPRMTDESSTDEYETDESSGDDAPLAKRRITRALKRGQVEDAMGVSYTEDISSSSALAQRQMSKPTTPMVLKVEEGE